MRIILTKLLIVTFLLASAMFARADEKPSYVGEYAQKSIVGTMNKVDFPRCKQIDSALLVNDGDLYILSECDIDQPKIKSIRIWRSKHDGKIGLKITGEIILSWQKLDQNRRYPLVLCNRKSNSESNVGGYIVFINGKLSIKDGFLYFEVKDNGTIEKVPYTEIDSCDTGEM
jgi:hypothetical protein